MDERLAESLERLNPEQRAAVVHDGSPLLILAGAGSGKTRVITTKIAYLIAERHVDPYSILAVTFTKKAANEMRERAVLLEPRAEYAQIRTFHSWGAYFLRKHAAAADISSNFTVYDDDDMLSLVGKAVPSLSRQQAAVAAHKISLAKDYCLDPESDGLSTITDDPAFAGIYAAYMQRLHETGNVDFGDLIMRPFQLLRDVAALRHEAHLRYRVILVDEYQDSNVAQFQLLQQLVGHAEGAGVSVCVVGDDDQSIYKFRGAEVQNILHFQTEFPGTKIVRLETNYRSTSEILACADSVVKNNGNRLGKTLRASRGAGKLPTLVFLPTQDDETQFCAEVIEQAHRNGVPYRDWAILYRTNAQSRSFETEFLHRRIPYTLIGSFRFYEREEVKDALAWLSFIANPRDEIAFRRIVNKPAKSVGETSQNKIVAASAGKSILDGCAAAALSKKTRCAVTAFCENVESCAALLQGNEKEKLAFFIERLVERSGLEEFYKTQDDVAGSQKVANLQELVNSAVLYPCTMAGLLDFLDHIQLDRTVEHDEDADGDRDSVTLVTLHNTKGLEFPRVIITGMENGIFPREDKCGAELEEERRLFYVGITRAQDELYLTCCGFRQLYGRSNYMSPSPFLSEIAKGQLRVLGQRPSSFVQTGGRDPVAQKYCLGACVYHDEYGHGQIVRGDTTAEGEYVISVSFENGGIKTFLPKYQAKSLMIEQND